MQVLFAKEKVFFQPAFHGFGGRSIGPSLFVRPLDHVLTPVDVVILFRQYNSIVEQHRLDMTFDAPEAFDQVITPAKKATELLLLMIGDVNAFQSSCLKFLCQVSTVYLICFCGYLFIAPGDVTWIDNQ